jgi:hypothetical protein
MVECLRQLKRAEHSENTGRKRKHNQRLLAEELALFETDVKDETEKTKRKCKKIILNVFP